jgi:phospholipid/cholesterol/gamma-HCH transport system ATP-binding protein
LQEHSALPKRIIGELVAMKIAMVGLPAEAANKYPAELSGGMRKRAGLARALALDPQILFLDEPTAGLDPIGAAEFDKLIGALQRTLSLTVVMVTHDLDSLYAICDRISVLLDKRVKVGTITELLREPDTWIQAYFRGPRGRVAEQAATRREQSVGERPDGDRNGEGDGRSDGNTR